MSAGEAEEVSQEAAEAEALLQRQWAARIGLPQLRIMQRVGTREPCLPFTGALPCTKPDQSKPPCPVLQGK